MVYGTIMPYGNESFYNLQYLTILTNILLYWMACGGGTTVCQYYNSVLA